MKATKVLSVLMTIVTVSVCLSSCLVHKDEDNKIPEGAVSISSEESAEITEMLESGMDEMQIAETLSSMESDAFEEDSEEEEIQVTEGVSAESSPVQTLTVSETNGSSARPRQVTPTSSATVPTGATIITTTPTSVPSAATNPVVTTRPTATPTARPTTMPAATVTPRPTTRPTTAPGTAKTYLTVRIISPSGTVTGAGSYTYGTKVTITATPSSGYQLSGWFQMRKDGEYAFYSRSQSLQVTVIDPNSTAATNSNVYANRYYAMFTEIRATPTPRPATGSYQTAAENEFITMVNNYRKAYCVEQGLSYYVPVRMTDSAHANARTRAKEASVNWSHSSSSGISYIAENLYQGGATASHCFEGWKGSTAGHNAVMLMNANSSSYDYLEVGIGIYKVPEGWACAAFIVTARHRGTPPSSGYVAPTATPTPIPTSTPVPTATPVPVETAQQTQETTAPSAETSADEGGSNSDNEGGD